MARCLGNDVEIALRELLVCPVHGGDLPPDLSLLHDVSPVLLAGLMQEHRDLDVGISAGAIWIQRLRPHVRGELDFRDGIDRICVAGDDCGDCVHCERLRGVLCVALYGSVWQCEVV